MAWETTPALTLIVLAFVFLPRYLKSGISTIPQFLENRFGKAMRVVASLVFIYAIVIGFLPFVLYGLYRLIAARQRSSSPHAETLGRAD